MSEPPAAQKRTPFTRLHAVVVIAIIMVIVTLFVFLSKEPVTSQNTDQLIQLKDQSLSQIHASLNNIHEVTLTPAIESEQLQPGTSFKEIIIEIKPGHSLAYIFKKLHLNQQDLYRIMQKGEPAKVLRNLQPGHILAIESNLQGQLQKLSYQINHLQSIQVKRVENDFIIETSSKSIEKRTSFSNGIIQSSLFEAGKEAGLSDALVMEMANVFGWDIDFALDIRQGDKFSVLYEEQFIEGKKYQSGSILAAEFTSQGNTYKAIRFTDKSGRTNYYTPSGLSMRKAFLRTPVDFRRISSRFGNRKHPVLNRMRLHKGVDYAAPRGTSIHVSGDGKIIYKGRKGGYGRVVIVQHGSRYQTLYAHMSSFKRGISVGKHVKQGQTIGFVGQSGRATGPHLHYEFRVNGTHRNPLTVKLPSSAPIQSAFKANFIAHAERLLSQIDTHKPTHIALNEQ